MKRPEGGPLSSSARGPTTRPQRTASPASHPEPPAKARPGDFVQSLERGLAVMRAFRADRARQTLNEVAQVTGLTRAAARRFLLTLVELGYVRNEGRTFSLRPRVLDLGYPYLVDLSLPEVARPFVEGLVARVRESSSSLFLTRARLSTSPIGPHGG